MPLIMMTLVTILRLCQYSMTFAVCSRGEAADGCQASSSGPATSELCSRPQWTLLAVTISWDNVIYCQRIVMLLSH